MDMSGSPTTQLGHMVPGSLTYNAIMSATTLTYSGKVFYTPESGGSCSIEMIIQAPPSGQSARLVDIPGSLTVDIGSTAVPESNLVDRYTITSISPSGTSSASVRSYPIASVDHVVVNVNGGSSELIVNGRRVTVGNVPDMPPASQVKIGGTAAMRLWGAVIRPNVLPEDYCEEIYDLLRRYPLPSEADAALDAASFRFTHDDIEFDRSVNLEDINYSDPSYSSVMFNGYDGDVELPTETFYERIPTFGEELDGGVVIESNRVAMKVYAENGEVEASSGEIGYSEILEIPSSYGPVIGADISVLASNDEPIHTKIGFVRTVPSVTSLSMPGHSATIEYGSKLVGEKRQFGGGLVGKVTIESSEIPEPDEFGQIVDQSPEAYGLWVYLQSSGTILTGSGFSVSAGAGITATGVSNLRVNGSTPPSTLSPGWYHIAFIPTTKSNSPVVVGSATSSFVLYSFSKYYAPNPSTYINRTYSEYVDPADVTASGGAGEISISDSGARVYSHEWSIQAAD